MLEKKAKQICEILIEELDWIDRNNINEAINETVDTEVIYYKDCFPLAEEADLRNLDKGLWQNAETFNEMVQAIAWTALNQEVYNQIYDNYPELEKLLR